MWWDDPCGWCGALLCDACDEASLVWWGCTYGIGPRRAGAGCGHAAYLRSRDLLSALPSASR
jgi:hypothetical protein